ncbi:MAG: Co2+/Mg2+ efflux protein ApaG [Candidatus Krumholzibacteriia bacterium]|nr:Co2+/Mg2+ efflux protein ApaG [Candidatus Latescibacterota bacterium]
MSDVDGKIEVTAEAFYLPQRSAPEQGYYFFAYRIRIRNAGEAPAQLLERHWIITDAAGQVQEVHGPGVVGEQPRLEPGEEFVYNSFCPLPTPLGSMRGSYTMQRDDGERFTAPIPVFTLATPHSLN